MFPDNDEGVVATVFVSLAKVAPVLQMKLILEVVPPFAFIWAFIVVVVSPILLAALIVVVGGPIGVNDRIEPKEVPTELVALARK